MTAFANAKHSGTDAEYRVSMDGAPGNADRTQDQCAAQTGVREQQTGKRTFRVWRTANNRASRRALP
jgi:hypothetical protein